MPPSLLTLAACVIGLTVSVVPMFITGTAVMLVPITADTGWSRGDASAIIATGLTSIAIGTAIVGRLIAIFGARPVIATSTLAFALALVVFPLAPTLTWAIILAAAVGLFGTGASQFAYLNVLPLWFDRRLGLSFGVAMLGIGLGNAIVPLLAEHFQHLWGWRQVYWVMAGVAVLVAFPNALFLLRVPKRISANAGAPLIAYGVTARTAVRGRQFWQMALCFFLATTVIAGFGVHLPSLMRDRGFGAAEAAGIFSIWGIALMVARFAGGFLLDLIDGRWIGAGFLIGASAGAAMLAAGLTGPMVIIAVILLAMAHGVEGDLVPYLTRSYFGLRAYSTIYGLLGLAFGLGPILGSLLMGKTFDHFGTYTPMLWAVAIVAALAALLLLTIAQAPDWRDRPGGKGPPANPNAQHL